MLDTVTHVQERPNWLAWLESNYQNWSFLHKNSDDPLYIGDEPDKIIVLEGLIGLHTISRKGNKTSTRVRPSTPELQIEWDAFLLAVPKNTFEALAEDEQDINPDGTYGANDPMTIVENDPTLNGKLNSAHDRTPIHFPQSGDIPAHDWTPPKLGCFAG